MTDGDTAPALDAECPQTWLARRLAAGLPAASWKAMARVGRCAFTGSRCPTPAVPGPCPAPAATGAPSKAGRYPPASTQAATSRWTCDVTTRTARAPTPSPSRRPSCGRSTAPARGMDASHLYGNPAHNWYPEGLAWEDKPTNEGRKIDRPPPPEPTHPCRNAPACPNLVLNEGRRCEPCCAEAGRDIAAMLRDHRPLSEGADKYGYTTLDWPTSLP